MYDKISEFLKDKKRICIIQAENPDGDSLGSAIALDYLLKDQEVSLYCPIDIPRYLRYFPDWSRVNQDFDYRAEGYIIVDTAATVLLSKLLDFAPTRNKLHDSPVLVIDHHESEDDLNFEHEKIIENRPACAELIYRIAKDQGWEIGQPAAEALLQGISSDTLGFTSVSTTAETFEIVADLVRLGANYSELEDARREFMKKSPRILDYKADLIKRIDYLFDGRLVAVHIPWEDIVEYSNEYNPNALILEEMRMLENVEVAIAVKTYPDGKVTGKIRTTVPVAEEIAGYFGGGGHAYAAGFRTYDLSYDQVLRDLVDIMQKVLPEEDYDDE